MGLCLPLTLWTGGTEARSLVLASKMARTDSVIRPASFLSSAVVGSLMGICERYNLLYANHPLWNGVVTF